MSQAAQHADRIAAVKAEVRERHTDSTADRYVRGAQRFMEYLEAEDVDPFNVVSRDFKRYMNGLIAEDYAYGSLQPRMYGPRAFYRAAADLRAEQQELLDAGRDLDGPKIPEVSDPTEPFSLGDFDVDSRSKQADALKAAGDHHKLTQAEVDQLVEHVPAPRLRNQLIIRLMYQCCLRRGELVRLEVDHVNRGARTIDVPAVKGNKGRETPIPYRATLDDMLGVWLDVERQGVAMADASPYLFPTERSERLSEDFVSELVRESAKRADLQGEKLYTDNMGRDKWRVHSHTLRASGAHRYWDQSGDIYFVSKILGHQDVDTTERYLDVDQDELIKKARENW